MPRASLSAAAALLALLAGTVPAAPAVSAAAPAAPAPKAGGRGRVVLVGWDGADWTLLDPLVARGLLPNLAAMIAGGRTARLASFEPEVSPIVWTTLATGLAPTDHGVADFTEWDPALKLPRPVTGLSRRVPALWNVASAAGLKVGVVGWWASWPAEEVNGFLVSDRATPMAADREEAALPQALAWPPELDDTVRLLVRRESRPADLSPLLSVTKAELDRAAASGKGLGDPIEGTRRVLGETRLVEKLSVELAQRRRPDLLMTYFRGTDEIGHVLGRYVAPPLEGVSAEESRRFGGGVAGLYAVADEALGRLRAYAREQGATLVLVSDHGFRWGDDRPGGTEGSDAAAAYLWHAPEGVLVAEGPAVLPSARRDAASVFDVVPTLCRLLSLPADPKAPGRSLDGWFAKGTPPSLPRKSWSSLATVRRLPVKADAEATKKEAREEVERLIALGYLAGARAASGAGVAAPASDAARRLTTGGLNNLGLYEKGKRNWAASEKYLRSAVSADPGIPEFRENLADVLEARGLWAEADAEAIRAARSRPAPAGVEKLVARAVRRTVEKKPDRALALLGSARASLGEAGGTLPDAVGRLSLDLGRPREAAAAFRDVVALRPGDPAAWLMLSRAARAAGESAEALRALDRAAALDPSNPDVAAERARQGGSR